jgi:hypothetical protein
MSNLTEHERYGAFPYNNMAWEKAPIGIDRDLGKQVILDANVLRTDGATEVGIMRYAGQTSVVDIMQAHQMTHRLPRV